MMRIFILLLSITTLASCSKQTWYDSARDTQTSQCLKQPLSEYDECNQTADKSFNKYEKDREELFKEHEQKNSH